MRNDQTQTTEEDLTKRDWYAAEIDYLRQYDYGRPTMKQLWHEDTIEMRAWEIYKARMKGSRGFLI